MKNGARASKVTVSADGRGLVSQAGAVLLWETIQVTGVGRGLSQGLARWRAPRAVHDPGKIVADLAAAVALGGDCLADIAVLREQPDLAWPVASDPVVSRLVSVLAADLPRSLRAIRAGRPLTADEVKRLGRQLTRALAHIHARGIIHRDISPANIWLDQRGVAHLGDFDTAIRRGTPQDSAISAATAEGYAAPELRTGDAADERSDLYAMGAVLYEALTFRRAPTVGVTSVSRSLAQLRPEVPLRLRLLVSRLLEEAREQRPQSAEDVLHELRRTPDEVLDELRRVRGSAHDEFRSASEELILGSDEAWISTLPFRSRQFFGFTSPSPTRLAKPAWR